MRIIQQVFYVLLFLMGISLSTSSAATIHVKQDAAGANNGTSWTDAYTNLQDAIDAATSGDQIWVSHGTYTPTFSPPFTSTNAISSEVMQTIMHNWLATYYITKNVEIYGGFMGTETALSQRVLNPNFETILMGSTAAHVVLVSYDSSFSGPGVTLDGLTIRNNHNAQARFFQINFGVYFQMNGNFIQLCQGGGLYIFGPGQNTIRNCRFENNNTREGGGAVKCQGGPTNTFTNNVFRDNYSAYWDFNGGALLLEQSTNTFTANTFHGNEAGSQGGAMISFLSNNTFTNNVFYDNSARFGGAVSLNILSNSTFINNTFLGNSADFGGAINLDGVGATIHNSIFWGNKRSGNTNVAGADIEQDSGPAPAITIENSLTQENSYYSSGTGVINNQDPLFLNPSDPDGADNIYGTPDDGLRLIPCSPAINQGDNSAASSISTDFLGNPRTDFVVDMGAYENKDYFPISSDILEADAECTSNGKTRYYNIENNAYLLSITKNGNDIGKVGDGTFNVKVGGSGVTNLGTNSASPAPYALVPDWYVMNRYWDVTPTTQPSSDVFVTFDFSLQDYEDLAAVTNITSKFDLTFYKINGNYNPDPSLGHSDAPTTPASSYDSDGYFEYTYTGQTTPSIGYYSDAYGFGNEGGVKFRVSSFSGGGGGAGGSNNSALPVELLEFNGENRNNDNYLYWTTASENNNLGFEIERSNDGNDFERIGFVEGGMNQTELSNYIFIDENPINGNNYYRLKQLDIDGQFEFSNVILITIQKNTSKLSEIYPNPTSGNTVFLDFYSEENSDIKISISDLSGQIIKNEMLNNQVGNNTFQLDCTHLEKGIYLVEILMGNQLYTRKLIVQ